MFTGGGANGPQSIFRIPAGALYTLRNPDINWMYEGVGSPGLPGRAIDHARDRTLGGSGYINGHIYSRGRKADFDHGHRLVIGDGGSPMYSRTL